MLFLKETPPVQGIVRARDGGGFDRQGASSYDAWVERFQVIFEGMLAAQPFYVQLCYLDENGDAHVAGR